MLIESELRLVGRNRTLINKQPVRQSRDLQDSLLVTVFSPDDLSLVKGGPAERRKYLDLLLADHDLKSASTQRDLERVLKQRSTLLRQSNGRISPEIAATLDVWDAKFSEFGELLGSQRAELVVQIQPLVQYFYRTLAIESAGVEAEDISIGLSMVTDWRIEDGGKGLSEALIANRTADVARGVTSVGPHRDELTLTISGLPARTHASQGEQRTLALAMRLAGHVLLTQKVGAPPILLLDDVFSELDQKRSKALFNALPEGQALLTTASPLPDGVAPNSVISIEYGSILQ